VPVTVPHEENVFGRRTEEKVFLLVGQLTIKGLELVLSEEGRNKHRFGVA
jgi:hypothetical protein